MNYTVIAIIAVVFLAAFNFDFIKDLVTGKILKWNPLIILGTPQRNARATNFITHITVSPQFYNDPMVNSMGSFGGVMCQEAAEQSIKRRKPWIRMTNRPAVEFFGRSVMCVYNCQYVTPTYSYDSMCRVQAKHLYKSAAYPHLQKYTEEQLFEEMMKCLNKATKWYKANSKFVKWARATELAN